MRTKKVKPETKAQEALRLLKDIPTDKFITGKFTNGEDGCCVLGHYNRLKSNNPEDYSTSNISWKNEGEELRLLSSKFMSKVHNKGYYNLADANNEESEKFYTQPTSKERSIAMLQDMVKAGY